MTVTFCILFGTIVIIKFSNLIQAALLGHLTIDANSDNPEVNNDKSKVCTIVWAKIKKKIGLKSEEEEKPGK